MKKRFSEHLNEMKKKKEEGDPEKISKEIEKEDKPSETKEPIKDIVTDPDKFEVKVVYQKSHGDIKVKVEKNVYTFSDEEVEKLKDVLNSIGNPKFTSSGNVINVFRAEKAFVFIPDSNYMMNMALRKADSKIVGDFHAFKNTKDEKNMNIASNDEDFYGMVVPVGINGSFEFSIKELEDLDKLKMKLCGAIKQFEEATGWAKSDVESWENFIKRNTANDEIDYGESFKSSKSNKVISESSFGDKMAELIREVYQKLPLEDAAKFYMDINKVITKYSFVDRSNVPVGNTPSLGNKELDNTEDVTIPRPAQPVEKPRPSEID